MRQGAAQRATSSNWCAWMRVCSHTGCDPQHADACSCPFSTLSRPDDLETTLQGILDFDSPFKSLGQPKEAGPQTLVCNITLPQQGQQGQQAQQKDAVPDQAKPSQNQTQGQSQGQQQEPKQESQQASSTVKREQAPFSSWLAFVLCIPRDSSEDGYVRRGREPSHDGSEHDFLSAYQRAQQVPVRAPSIRRRREYRMGTGLIPCWFRGAPTGRRLLTRVTETVLRPHAAKPVALNTCCSERTQPEQRL